MVQESPSIPVRCTKLCQIGYKTLKSQMWFYHPRMLNIHACSRIMLNHQAKTHFAVRVAEVLPPTSTTCPECGKVSIRTENNLNHWIGVHSTFKAWVREKLLEKEGGSSSAESESDLEDVIIEVSDNSSDRGGQES